MAARAKAAKDARSTRSKKGSAPLLSAASKKRPRPNESTPVSTKRLKSTINTAPSQVLDVYVFGSGESGELGLGPKTIDGQEPMNAECPRLNKLLDTKTVGILQIAVGGMHCVSLSRDKQIYTWGIDDDGALGRDTVCDAEDDEDYDLSPKESTPTAIASELFQKMGVESFVQIAATDSASFALSSDGSVYGWGTFRGNDGTWGFSTSAAMDAEKTKNQRKRFQRVPTLVPYLKKITSLATGSNHVLALDVHGKVYSWGTGEQGQLGRRTLERTRFQALTPCRFGLPEIRYIACGAYHSFAIDINDQVYAWGLNNFGQTGISNGADDEKSFVEKPTIVDQLKSYRIKEIKGGNHHSIACTEDGKVLTWGRCDEGQTGIDLDHSEKEDLVFDSRGNPRILKKPTRIPDIDAVFVAAGIDNSIAISRDGKAYSWGYSENFRTGLGTEKTVKVATLVGGDVTEKVLSFAGCGGQFSVLAGPAGKS